jgi:hypothetical protein
MVANFLIHLEHVNSGLLKHSLHLGIAANLPLIRRILEVVGLDMFPKSLDDLRAGELRFLG